MAIVTRGSSGFIPLTPAWLVTLLLAFADVVPNEGAAVRGSSPLAPTDENSVADHVEGVTNGRRALRVPTLSTETPFSQEWIKLLVSGPMGCSSWRTVGYTWQDASLATNVNNMLETWIYAIAGRQREDLAIIDDWGYFDYISCARESKGEQKHGWTCVWAPTPHLCYYSSEEQWKAFMRERGASDPDISSATGVTFRDVRTASINHADDWFRSFGTAESGAYQVLSKLLLWNHLQPWMKKAVREMVIHSPTEVRQNPFIGLHIRTSEMYGFGGGSRRRGSRVDAERYLSSSRGYLQRIAAWISVEDIRGIWVVADDPAIVREIRTCAQSYFPSVSAVVNISEKEDTGGKPSYDSMVRTLTDLLQLSRSTLFVGPSNSDVTSLVALLRTQLDMSQSSVLSVDF